MSPSNGGGNLDMDNVDKARCRNQGVVLDVPLDPVVQEHEVMCSAAEAGSRKFGPKVMAEKVAGSGVFFRAFVKASKADRVLLYFPADTDPCILEWVYKLSSRIHRGNSSSKATWKYQGNGAWKLIEKSKKKLKGCKRGKLANNVNTGTQNATDLSPMSPQCHEDEPERKKRSQAGSSSKHGEVIGQTIDTPWIESPVSRWFSCHLRLTGNCSKSTAVHTSTDSRGPSGNRAQQSTPQVSADDACQSTQHVDDAMISVDSTLHDMREQNVRLSCTGLVDGHSGQRMGEHACELRFQRAFDDDDGSNSDAMPNNSPSASGCEVPHEQTKPKLDKQWEQSHNWSHGSPSNASGSDEQIVFKARNCMHFPSTTSLSDYSCDALQSCR